MSGVVPLVGGDVRVGAVLEQQPHDVHVARERGAQERGLAGEIHPGQRAEPRDEPAFGRKFLRACVRVRAVLEQRGDRVERRCAVDAVVARRAVDVESRTSTAAHSGVSPYQSLALTLAPRSMSSCATPK